MTDPAPVGGWRRLLVLYSLAGFVEAVFWGQIGAFTPLHLPRLGVAAADIPAVTGAIAAISGLLGLPFLPFWGALADRYGRKPIIIRSFVAHFLAGIITLAAPNVGVFVIGRAVMSFALGNSGLMMTTLAERVRAGRLGLAFTIMNTAGPIGVFLGPLAGGPFMDRYGLPALLALDTALLGAVILALALGYRDPYRGTSRQPLRRMALDSVALIGRSPRLRALFPALFFLFAGWMLAMTYVPLAVTALYKGEDPGTAVGLVLGAGGFIALAIGPALGAVADRTSHWRVVFVGSATCVLLWPLPALAPDLRTFTAAWMILNGITTGVFALSFSLLATSAPAGARGRVMTFAYLPINVGSMIGPAVGSTITRESIFVVFPAAAAFTLCGLVLLAVAARTGATGDGSPPPA
jgi:DHA1 family multidrug resistance protein-like MFS transporter